MSEEQALKILNVLGAAGNCLHHQQILDTRESYPDTAHVMIFTVGDRRTLEKRARRM